MQCLIIVDSYMWQVPALALGTAAVVHLDPVRENLQTATVTVCAISSKIAALMQMHCVR